MKGFSRSRAFVMCVSLKRTCSFPFCFATELLAPTKPHNPLNFYYIFAKVCLRIKDTTFVCAMSPDIEYSMVKIMELYMTNLCSEESSKKSAYFKIEL